MPLFSKYKQSALVVCLDLVFMQVASRQRSLIKLKIASFFSINKTYKCTDFVFWSNTAESSARCFLSFAQTFIFVWWFIWCRSWDFTRAYYINSAMKLLFVRLFGLRFMYLYLIKRKLYSLYLILKLSYHVFEILRLRKTSFLFFFSFATHTFRVCTLWFTVSVRKFNTGYRSVHKSFLVTKTCFSLYVVWVDIL